MDAAAPTALISSPAGVLTMLVPIAAGFFWIEKKTNWTLFKYFPPLIFIYATPIILSNTGILTQSSPVYSTLRSLGLPAVICLLPISVDVGKAVRILGRGVLVMLAGSWIGGTGNMAAVQLAIDTSDAQFGLATLTDNLVYVVWLPIMIGCRAYGDRFNRWAKVPEDRIAKMAAAAAGETTEERVPLLRVDIHTLAIASAANPGGAASAPVVAAAHRQTLVPASILMALLGYAYGTPLAISMARLCEFFTRSTPAG